MKVGSQDIIEKRGEQMFPVLSQAEMLRLNRFGELQFYTAGKALVRTGETGHGLTVILRGEVEITSRESSGASAHIVTHGSGEFIGELGQLSGRPALIDALAVSDVDILVIGPEALRSLVVTEAELGERIMRALILRRVGLLETGGGGPVIVGQAADKDVLRIAGFLTRNGHPHLKFDPADDVDARTLIERFEVPLAHLPIVLCPNGVVLRNPSETELAECIGLTAKIDQCRLFDVVVVGAGPAGLATSVYGASEGLSVLTLDCRSFGGQAGASARIENFLGFPTGISGMALMARAYAQSQKFGVQMGIPNEAARLSIGGPSGCENHITLTGGEMVRARAVVIATGARYRRLAVDGIEAFEDSSVHYWASPLEGRLCIGQDVALVGGGNSAGQAAVFLAGFAKQVTILVRRPLRDTMSQYLAERIEALANVQVIADAKVTGLVGQSGKLETILWQSEASRTVNECRANHLFLFIGATPNTDWLVGSGVLLDARGFIVTGSDAAADRLMLETSRPGVFAIGDVRAGSAKRVASAAGDGAQVVAVIHEYLREACSRHDLSIIGNDEN